MADAGPQLVGLLVRTVGGASLALDADHRARLAGAGIELEALFPQAAERLDLAPTSEGRWWRSGVPDASALAGRNPWDVAHERAEHLAGALGVADGEVYVEPDLEQRFPAFPEPRADRVGALGRGTPGVEDGEDPAFPRGGAFAWHLRDDYSQLRAAREAVSEAEQRAVRIAHLDTGYDGRHETLPVNLAPALGWNFVEGKADAQDPAAGGLNPGHGTGTLGILAGKGVSAHPEPIGGAPFAEVVPLRIAKSVVLLRTSALVSALGHLLTLARDDGAPPVDVVTLSMGGLASRAWADAVNRAYDAGICIVAAAGNNFSTGVIPFPTGFIVYPARFRRVIAACGIMADRTPYADRPAGQMQGNHGPRSKMATAISAFTPNTPWAELGAEAIVDMNGAGTSSATPQVAAAAALWLARHRGALRHREPWERVEAVRWALFASADQTADGGRPDKLGNGTLRALDALELRPPERLARTPRDSAGLAILRVLTGLGLALSPRDEMLVMEATQLMQQGYLAGSDRVVFDELVRDPDLPVSALPAPQLRSLLDALARHPLASEALRTRLATVGSGLGPSRPERARPAVAAKLHAPGPRRPEAPVPPRPNAPVARKLRAYAFDPSLQLQLDTAPISEATIAIPWEDDLQPGPVGEYLEVVDVDPASTCVYPPVNLNERAILAQNGLPPSEATPQFHQQMVYAVASRTIRYFEQALGRRTLWAPRRLPDEPYDDSQFVQRLRIYPHALREANAYYSPAKVALLFGYFRASPDDPGNHLPGGMVFTCLSHDVVAHETAHALLDGMHRRLVQATNPDMRAFHEAFADVVALLQHFTFPEILRHQISRTRGEIRQQSNLLGQLAGQFGHATGRRGALRDYIGTFDRETKVWHPREARPDDYLRATEPHERGAVLVAAVFDAFLAIYEARTRDLLRLATGGSGVLPAGAIHPDLVGRLAEEARKSAEHVLGMCVRALDYCPPVDLTFGEYLRAILTADRDLVRDDDLGYRVAFMDAFRRRGIYPGEIRVLSEESLLWRGPEGDRIPPSPQLLACFSLLQDYAHRHQRASTREEVFHLARAMRRELHERLADHLRTARTAVNDADFLGIEAGSGFEVHSARYAARVGPDGQLLPQFIVEIIQRKPLDPAAKGGPKFEGGAAVVVDVRTLEPRYAIRKRIRSETRMRRQQEFLGSALSLWDTYLARSWGQGEPLALAHRT